MLVTIDAANQKQTGTFDVRRGKPVVEGDAGWLAGVERDGVTWRQWGAFQKRMNHWSNGYVLVTAGPPAKVAAAAPATVDVATMDAQYQQAVTDLTTGWEQAAGPLITALAVAVAAEVAGGALTGLAALAIPPATVAALTTLVTDGLIGLAGQSAKAAAVEVRPLATVSPTLTRRTRTRIEQLAGTTTDLIVAGCRSAATRVAMNQAGSNPDAEQVRDAVETALTDLSAAKDGGLVAGNLSAAAGTAQGAGREQVFGELPDGVQFRASEELDRNTCPPCRKVDGREYASFEAALADYPTGRYRACEGRDRCRGFIYAVLDDEAQVAAGVDGGTVAAHLPGRHDQGKHGNRFNKPGDRSSGLRRPGRARDGKTSKAPLTGQAAMAAVPKGLFKPDTLTPAQSRALQFYETSMFRTINGELRSGNPKGMVARTAAEIDSAMDGSVLPADIQVWRGMYTARELFQDSLDGDLTGFSWKELGYSSTTTEERIAHDFMVLTRERYQGQNVKLRVTVPAGVKAVQISTAEKGSQYNGPQAEVTLQRDVRWRIVKDHGVHPDGYRLLDAEVMAE